MKKAGAGLLRSIMSLVLIGGFWMSGDMRAFGEDGVVESTAPTNAAKLAYTYPARLAKLQTADLEQLREKLAVTEVALDEVDVAAFNAPIQVARDNARTHSPEVLAIEAKIVALNDEFKWAINRDPGVVAAEAEANRSHMEFMDTLHFRTGLLKLIAEKERQGNWEVPMPVMEEKAK